MTTDVREQRTYDTPERSLEQRMSALWKANQVRTLRARSKRDVRHSESKRESLSKLAELIADPPAHMQTMKVLDLLLTGQKIGRVKANRMINRLQVSSSKRLGGLSQRQREALVRELRS